jgi:uncharacterized membrane protein
MASRAAPWMGIFTFASTSSVCMRARGLAMCSTPWEISRSLCGMSVFISDSKNRTRGAARAGSSAGGSSSRPAPASSRLCSFCSRAWCDG